MDIKQILDDHKLWLADWTLGKRADLSRADLLGANLRRADLTSANLRRADLLGANLRRADLRGANLSGANLHGADLSGANLSGADLRRANLHSADLSGANLSSANLHGADLTSANLDSPIYQFYLGTFAAVATIEYLQIGCERHDWATWLKDYVTIGMDNRFSDKEINDHGKVIKLYHSLLVGESK